MLNAQLWNEPRGAGAAELAAAQVTWLRSELALEDTRGATHVLAFCHIPPFVYDPDEPDGYANIIRAGRFELLNILAENGVSHIFCGHFHQNVTRRFRGVEVVVTGSSAVNIPSKPETSPAQRVQKAGHDWAHSFMGEDCSGLRRVDVTRERISHGWHTLAELKRGQASGSSEACAICVDE